MDPETAFDLGVLPGTTINVDPGSAYPIAGQAGAALGTGAGSHGLWAIAPGTDYRSGGGTVQDAVNSVWAWLNAPLNHPMSPTGIFLLVGTILIAIILWNLILYHIRIAAETL